MKQFLFISAFFIFLTACNSKKNEKFFYDENNTNRTKEILTYNNDLFIIGQHNFTQNNIERTTSILCIDTNFIKKWELHLGDNKTNERFQNFAADKLGNLYITGNISSLNTSILIKASKTGQIIWRKEFKNISSLDQIKFLNDSSLIIAGTKRLSEMDLLNDSAFIQKIDTNGNTVWNMPISKDIGLRFLEIQNSKIIFCLNSGVFNGYYLNSKLFILNENGAIEKAADLDFKAAGTGLGVKAIKLFINKSNDINILTQSYNRDDPNIRLLFFDSLGNYTRSVEYDPKKQMQNTNENDKLYLHTGLSISGAGVKNGEIVINEKNSGEIYFTTNESNNNKVSFTNSIELNNTLYILGDVNDNNNAKWRIAKEN
jgi:hypothetical protein